MKRATKKVGLLAYDGFQALDLAGPLDVFDAANDCTKGVQPAYELLVIGVERGPCASNSGLSIRPHCVLADAPPLDTLIVPGGSGLRMNDAACAKVAAWLRGRAPSTRRVASVCTGIYALAKSGLLDGRRATTHWAFAEEVARLYPAVRLEADLIFVKDGGIFTSAGISAGIDLALAFVEDDLGARVALAVARALVVYLKRSGGQLQYSEPLLFQSRSTDRFRELATWMTSHLDQDLSVEILAQRVHLSARHFSRQFKTAFGTTPAHYIERLPLDEARRRILSTEHGLEQVAHLIGFGSGDAFRRSFERRFGVNPSRYRLLFQSTKPASSAN